MKKFKKLIIFSLLFLLTGCNNQVNEIEVTSTKLDLPFLGEKYSYLDYVFKEDSENLNLVEDCPTYWCQCHGSR